MKTVSSAIAVFTDWAAKFGSCLIVAIMVFAVFMRYVMRDPVQWIEEILIAIFVWVIMLGAASLMRVRGHVSIDALTGMLPLPVQRWFTIAGDVVCIFSLTTLGWLGLDLAMEAGEKITPILMIPYTYIDLAMPVGCFLMAAYMLVFLWRDVTGRKGGTP